MGIIFAVSITAVAKIRYYLFIHVATDMSSFHILFGVAPKEVRKTCLLLPFTTKGMLKALGLEKLSSGELYATASHKDYTIIRTGMGAVFLGDAVLYLQETSCEDIILFGSCGALASGHFELGQIVVPEKCLAMESFSKILLKDFNSPRESFPHAELLKKFFAGKDTALIPQVTCVTFGSLKLEEKNMTHLKRMDVDVLDMECSAFFHAADYIRRKALSVLFVTDIIGQKPFFARRTKGEQDKIDLAISRGITLIQEFVRRPS